MSPDKIETQGPADVGVIGGSFEGEGFAGGSGGSQTPQTTKLVHPKPDADPKPPQSARAPAGLSPARSRGRGKRVVAVNMDTYRFLAAITRAVEVRKPRRAA